MKRLNEVLRNGELDIDKVTSIQAIYYNLDVESDIVIKEKFFENCNPEEYFVASLCKSRGKLKLVYCVPGFGDVDIITF